MVEQHGVGTIRFGNPRLDSFLRTTCDLQGLIAGLFPSIEIEVIDYPAQAGFPAHLQRALRLLRKARRWGTVKEALAARMEILLCSWRCRRPVKERKNILLFEPLYHLGFLRESLSGYNLIYYRDAESPYPEGLRGSIPEPRLDWNPAELEALLPRTADRELETAALSAIREDFTGRIAQCLRTVLFLKEVNARYPISLGIWGNSMGFQKYLVFEYLRSSGIKVLGTQHGNCYVDQISPWNFACDFDRCSHFISWGFTEDDLARAYPRAEPRPKIFPLGRALPAKRAAAKRRIDIVFPLTFTQPMLAGGCATSRPDALADNQVRILEYLNSLEGLSIYVKPFPFPNPGNCAILPVLKRLPNLRVIDDISFTRFLEEYSPRIVIVEFPASPLYDVRHLDAEIFLMPDAMNPFETQALSELKERVHYCESVEELASQLGLFLKGRLEPRQDPTFFDHYMRQGDPRKAILGLIDSLAGRPGGEIMGTKTCSFRSGK
ncbi:MAG: hypothetical protein NTY77_13860 [Elusimicrobia bacterium]|nr:hypothetical protein [Elusimicrobiota bacterium]